MESKNNSYDNQDQIHVNFSHSQQAAKIGSYEWDLITNKVIWSNELYKIYGFEPGEVEPSLELALSFVHPDDIEGMNEIKADSMGSTKPWIFENRIIRKDKYVRHVISRGEIIVDKENKPIKMMGSVQDITDRKLVLAELDEQKKFNEKLIDLNPGLIYVYDLDEKRNVYTSKSLAAMLGYEGEEITSLEEHKMRELLHPDDIESTIDHLKILKEDIKGIVYQNIFRMLHKNGHWVKLIGYDSVFKRDEFGNPEQIIGNAIGINDKDNLDFLSN